MNEFIVWDKEEDIFYTLENCKGVRDINFSQYGEIDNITLFEYLPDGSFQFKNRNIDDVEICNYIGKTDINDKKIYADCSIVEFYFGSDADDDIKITGYFSYNNTTLRYEIKDLNTHEAIYLWTGYTESILSIIDTIQENKLGLIK